MKVVAISDLHGRLPAIPECDLLLIAGDICPVNDHRPYSQALWLRLTFAQWLESVPARKIVIVWGNHDLLAERNPELVPALPCTVLTDELLEWEGLRIYGLPWQRRFFDWAFNLDEPELDEKYDATPACDIIVSHGPPYGHGDLAPRGQLCGSKAFLNAIDRTGCRLAVFGHIHNGRGTYQYGDAILANVAHVNEAYQPVYPPVEFEL